MSKNLASTSAPVGVLRHGHVMRYYRYCRHDDILLLIRMDACAANRSDFSDFRTIPVLLEVCS